jgi:hypothetical protein
MTMAASRDTTLSKMARMVAFWIFGNPSEAIDPESIASANELTVGYVRKLLAELAGKGYLVKPEKVRAEKGRIAYTPYAIPPQANTTVTVSQPSRSELPYGENNHHGQEVVTVEPTVSTDTPEITAVQAQITVSETVVDAPVSGDASPTPTPVYTHERDAATRVNRSVKEKAKGKRKKQKKKDIPPSGGTVPDSSSDSPKVDHREMMTAVCDAFKVKPGGFAGILGQQLLGVAVKGKRQEYGISPAMSAVEVVAFGQWYREAYPAMNGGSVKVPTTAETLFERVQQFRDDTTKHAKKMALSIGRLARLLAEKTGQGVSLVTPTSAPASLPYEREKPLDMNAAPPVQESEVEGLVKAGLMTADEFPRPTMKQINQRIFEKMGSNR